MFADILTLPDLSNLTATAMLGCYAWHTVSKTIPEILQMFREEVSEIRRECHAEREALYHELTAERIQRHHDHLAIVQSLEDLNRRFSRPAE